MRQIFFSILVWLTFSTSVLYADVDAQIEAIKNATVEERFKLMNAFKKNLVQMKEEERIDAMTKLTTQSKNKNAQKALDEIKQKSKRKSIQNNIEYHHIDETNIVNEANYQGGDND